MKCQDGGGGGFVDDESDLRACGTVVERIGSSSTRMSTWLPKLSYMETHLVSQKLSAPNNRPP